MDDYYNEIYIYLVVTDPAVVNVVNRATISQQENERIGNIAVQLSENVAVNNVGHFSKSITSMWILHIYNLCDCVSRRLVKQIFRIPN